LLSQTNVTIPLAWLAFFSICVWEHFISLTLSLSEIAKSSLDRVARSKVESLENLYSRISSFECRYARRSMKRILDCGYASHTVKGFGPRRNLVGWKTAKDPLDPKKHLTRPPTKYERVQRIYDGNLLISLTAGWSQACTSQARFFPFRESTRAWNSRNVGTENRATIFRKYKSYF